MQVRFFTKPEWVAPKSSERMANFILALGEKEIIKRVIENPAVAYRVKEGDEAETKFTTPVGIKAIRMGAGDVDKILKSVHDETGIPYPSLMRFLNMELNK